MNAAVAFPKSSSAVFAAMLLTGFIEFVQITHLRQFSTLVVGHDHLVSGMMGQPASHSYMNGTKVLPEGRLLSPSEPSYRSLLPEIHFDPIDHSKPRVALCACIYEEERYASEWIDYHLAIGFSEIIISDNSPNNTLQPWNNLYHNRVKVFSTPNHKSSILGPLPPTRQTLPQWQYEQNFACLHYLKQQPKPPDFVAFFDVDEFVALYQHDNMVDFMTDYVPDGSINLNYIMFGTANHSKYLEFPVTQRFRQQGWVDIGTKAFAKVEDVTRVKVHMVELKRGRKQRHFGTNKDGLKYKCCAYNATVDVAAIHHYYTKSLQEIQRRVVCRDGESCQGLKGRKIFVGDKRNDHVWDTLTRKLPQYKALEEPYQVALNEVYGERQNEEYQRAYEALKKNW